MDYIICTLIRNEHRYLKEWCEYHINLGFNKIYIYEDYGSNSHKDLDLPEECELIRMEDLYSNKEDIWNSRQYYLFETFRKAHKSGWCAFIDVDEYIQFNNGHTLEKLCNEFSDCDGIALYWKYASSNNHISRPEGKIIDNYTEFVSNKEVLDRGSDFKSLVNLEKCKLLVTLHMCGGCVRASDKSFIIEPFPRNRITYDKVLLNHYMCKSFLDWCERMNKPTLPPSFRKFDDYFNMNPFLLKHKDKLILFFKDKRTDYSNLEKEIWEKI